MKYHFDKMTFSYNVVVTFWLVLFANCLLSELNLKPKILLISFS